MSQCRDTGSTGDVLSYIIKDLRGRAVYMSQADLKRWMAAHNCDYTLLGKELVVYGADGAIVYLEIETLSRGMNELRTTTAKTILH